MISLHTLRKAPADIWWRMTLWMGHPHEIARRGFASCRLSHVMRDWIGNREKLVRRLVYLAALELMAAASHALLSAAPASRAAGMALVIPGRRPCLRILREGRAAKPGPYDRRMGDDDLDRRWQPVRRLGALIDPWDEEPG